MTPHYTTLDMVISLDIVIPSGVDETLYFEIHEGDDSVKLSNFSGQLIVPFNMLKQTKNYIIPVVNILRPMMVLGNWGDMSAKKKLAIMSMHSWRQIFRDIIHHHFK